MGLRGDDPRPTGLYFFQSPAAELTQRELGRKQARVLLVGPPATGKTTLARHLAMTMRPEPIFLSAGAFPSGRDLLAAVAEASRAPTGQTMIVDGYHELAEKDDSALLAGLLTATGLESLLVTSRSAPRAMSGRFTVISLGNWDRELMDAAAAERLDALGLLDRPESLFGLLHQRGTRNPLEVVGAVDAFADGGMAGAERWLSSDARRGEPELMLLRGADGLLTVTRAVRMPEARLLTSMSKEFTAVPLITLTRSGRAWVEEISELEVNQRPVR